MNLGKLVLFYLRALTCNSIRQNIKSDDFGGFLSVIVKGAVEHRMSISLKNYFIKLICFSA